MTYPKRLIEVDLPIKRISAHARREKSIRHGHISTLHIWWARRPLAACRAVICASLWPDPADPNCPQVFRDVALERMLAFAKATQADTKLSEICDNDSWQRYMKLANGVRIDADGRRVGVLAHQISDARNADSRRVDVLAHQLSDARNQEVGEYTHPTKLAGQGGAVDVRAGFSPSGGSPEGLDPTTLDGQIKLRAYLLDFIADFAAWEASTNRWFLDTARALTQAAHEALGGEKGTRPLVVDPFAGGGAIPLEALRVGADAFASDLNPVAVLLNKVVLEYIPKYGQKLADEVRKWGQWVKEQAEKELARFYPKDADGSTPIAYLWARTIQCEGPGCGAEVPLMRSLWLAKKGSRSVALRITPNPQHKRVDFEVIKEAKAKDVGEGTVRRGSATCPCCGYTTPVASVRVQLKARKGGAADARLFAVVTTRPAEQGRFYRLPTAADLATVRAAAAELDKRKAAWTGELSLVPEEPLPPQGTLGFRVQLYGMLQWGDLFTPRQLLSLTTLGRWVREAGKTLAKEHEAGFAEAVQACLAIVVDRQADICSSLCRWLPIEAIGSTFSRQAISMIWDFAEGIFLSNSSGSWDGAYNWVVRVIEDETRSHRHEARVERSSATDQRMPDDSAAAFVTDPPYYDAVPYSDLSDFFYVWLHRNLPLSQGPAFSTMLSPKVEECIVDQVKGKDRAFFEKTMQRAMGEGRRVLNPFGIGLIVFAHKSTAGWEAQLQAMVDAGWTITGSWPIDTERAVRMRAMDSAALASSVHLVCRPREDADGNVRENEVGDWRDVLAELPTRTAEWMARLSSEGVVGADAIFACLGPALEIFSRYSRVEKASGERVLLKEYLTHVWGAVAQEALAQIFKDADATGFEEDARLTAMWLWTLAGGKDGGGGRKAEGDDGEDEEAGDEEGDGSGTAIRLPPSSFILEFDAARKIAQGLGAHLEDLHGIIEVKGDKARLLSVGERTRRLFGKDEGDAPIPKRKKKDKQLKLFSLAEVESEEGGWGEKSVPKLGDTVLDRVHQSMILFTAARGEALRRFLVEDGAGQDQRFWKLANALSALYPQGTQEKRWVDGVLARKKGLGL